MKRFVSMLLTVCIIVGLLTGCGKSNWEQYEDAVSSLNGSDLKFTMELDVEGENELISDIADSDSIKLIFDGSVSADSEMAEMSLYLNIPSAQATVELTDIIVDGNKMYINGQKLFNVLTGSLGTEDIGSSLMGGKSYILMDMEADLNMDESQIVENDGLTTMIKNISDIYETAIKDHDAASKDGSTYILNLDGSAIKELVLAVIADIQSNKEAYYDSIVGMYSDDILETAGITREELNDSREELLSELDNMLTELKDSIEDADFADSSYTSKVDDKSMELALTFIMGDEINLKFSYSAEKTDMGSVQAPEDYITWSEFEEELNSLNEYSDIPAEEAEYGDTVPADNEEFSFNVTKGDSNPQILNADLSGYTYLTNYSLESDISGEVFSIPVIDGELYEDTGSVDSYTENSGLYISYYSWNMYGKEFLTYCEEFFREDYEFYGEYGYEACYSDAYVSADGNTVVMAVAYDLGSDYIYTDVYVFQYISEEEMLYGAVSIDNEYMDETESAILEEYSQLLGVDFTQYLNLFDKANASVI